MVNIIDPSENYNLDGLTLSHPTPVSSDANLSKMYLSGKPIYVQPQNCMHSKAGFVLAKNGKHCYIDLIFEQFDTFFVEFMQKLQSKSIDVIDKQSAIWFASKMERDDIETAFKPLITIFKTGKYYTMRVTVKVTNGKIDIGIFNENHEHIDASAILPTTTFIPILEPIGVKFTRSNFQFEIEMNQLRIYSPTIFTEKCLIKLPELLPQTQSLQPMQNVAADDDISLATTFPDDAPLVTTTTTDIITFSAPSSPMAVSPVAFDKFDDLDEYIMPPMSPTNLDCNESTPIKLIDPNYVYCEMYNKTLKLAEAKLLEANAKFQEATELKAQYEILYAEAQNINKKYMLTPYTNDNLAKVDINGDDDDDL